MPSELVKIGMEDLSLNYLIATESIAYENKQAEKAMERAKVNGKKRGHAIT